MPLNINLRRKSPFRTLVMNMERGVGVVISGLVRNDVRRLQQKNDTSIYLPINKPNADMRSIS